MVGPLQHREYDPQGKGRGAGRYYHRGRGKWSKYTPSRDRRIIARYPPQATPYGNYLQTGDVWAGIWRANEMRREIIGAYGQKKSIPTDEALQKAMKELSRITGIEPTKLEIRHKGIGTYQGPQGRRSGLRAAGLYVYKGYVGEPQPKIFVSRSYQDPMGVLFHEFGHHIHFTKKKPFDPTPMRMGNVTRFQYFDKRRVEAIAEAFERLYHEKVKEKKLTI